MKTLSSLVATVLALTSTSLAAPAPTATTDPNNCIPTAGNAVQNPGLARATQAPWVYYESTPSVSGAYVERYYKGDEGYKSYDGWTFIGYADKNKSHELSFYQNVPVLQGRENTLEYVYKIETHTPSPDGKPAAPYGKVVVRIDGRDYTTIDPPNVPTGSWVHGSTRFTPRAGATSKIEFAIQVANGNNIRVAFDDIFLPSKAGAVNPCP